MAIIAEDSDNIPRLLKVDASGNIKSIITDGTDDAIIETDDDDIAGSQKTVIVINLNYVWDAVSSKWVRMTQP